MISTGVEGEAGNTAAAGRLTLMVVVLIAVLVGVTRPSISAIEINTRGTKRLSTYEIIHITKESTIFLHSVFMK